MANPRIRVVLIDDHAVVREGLAGLLAQQPDLQLCGQASDAREALELVERTGPDIAVVDIGLPGVSGIEVARRVLQASPDTGVVMLTMYDDAPTVDRALRAGARGFVLKDAGVESLVEAIRAVRSGRVWLSPAVSGHVVQGYLAPTASPADLTPRELETLRLLAEGHTSREVGELLGVATKTVQNHRTRILEKLGARTTAGLAHHAVRLGLITSALDE